jgi:crotonobetainyl-CoA:carnitine CoA-transferase CaiB-like acyl-CoA transferase
MTSVPAALEGCTIVEIDLDEAGQYATRLLASLGARVVKLEALRGDEGRLRPPFADDLRGGRRSVPYDFLNAGKRSLAVDLDDAFAFRLVEGLVGERGAVVVSEPLRARIPARLKVPVIAHSLLGKDGAADPEGVSTSFTRFHAGGTGYLAPASRPVMPAGIAGDALAGVGLAVSILGVLAIGELDDEPGRAPLRADHSQLAHAANLEKMFTGRVAKQGVHLSREAHRFPFGGAQRCADGHVSMLVNEHHQWQGLSRVLGHPEWAEDPRFQGGSGRRDMADMITAALDAWCGERTVAQVLAAARAHHVPIGEVRPVQAILEDDTLRRRGFLHEEETAFGPLTSVALPFGQHPLWDPVPLGPAPTLGEHTFELLHALGHDDDRQSELEALALVRRAA